MASKYYNGVLKDHNKKETSYIHPQTNARQVLTGEKNETILQDELNTINDKLIKIKEQDRYKGAFKSYEQLTNVYPNNISSPGTRNGWTAIIQSEDAQYFYDTQENMWKVFKSGASDETILSVNGQIGPNVVLSGSDIDATIDGNSTKPITQHLQDIKNITSDIKQVTINGKSLSDDIELKATDIKTASGASVQSNLSDLDLKYNDQEDAIKEIENELEPLKNKTDVLYLNNDQMFEALNGIIEPYNNEQVVVCIDDGDYKKGSVYKFNISGDEANPIFEWEEITSSGGTEITDTLTLSKEVVIPEVPAKEGVRIDSVENISTDYKFELNEETGYYESNNKGKSSSYAVCKVTFTVPYTMNVVWDVINNGENNYDFGIFSQLGQTLSLSKDEDTNTTIVYKSYKNESSANVVQLVYENVEAGTHFITVKYKKDNSSDDGNDSLQFKLSDEIAYKPYEPEERYTSSNSITIGDHNNLQIEGKDILKDGDVKPTIPIKLGDENYQVNLSELDNGFYLITGKFKTKETGTTYSVTNGYLFAEIVRKGEFCIFHNYTSYSNYVFDMSKSGYDRSFILVSLSSNTIQTLVLFRYDSLVTSNKVLTLTNSTVYTPTNDYHPSTKKYVDDSVYNAETIKVFEDPINSNIESMKNKFATSDNVEDDKLYYYKSVGTAIIEKDIEVNKNYNDIIINKDISTTIGSGAYAMDSLIYTKNDSGSSVSNITLSVKTAYGQVSYISISCWINGATRIFELYNQTNGWDSSLLNEQKLSLKQILLEQWNLDNFSYFYINSFYIYEPWSKKIKGLAEGDLIKTIPVGGGVDEDALKQYLPKVIKLR